MFWRWFVSIAVLVCALDAPAQSATTIKLVDGATLAGQPIAFKDQFVQVRLDAGGYTNVPWARLSQETLRELTRNRTAAPYATVFLDPPQSRSSRTTGKPVALKPVPRIDRPTGGSLLASPVMLVLFLIIYVANIYAGYEIALYRQQAPALVCVLAAVVPLIGPAIFMAMPTRQPVIEQAPMETVEEQVLEEAPVVVEEAPVMHEERPAAPQAVVYPRGQFTFNRRFFETKFAGFLKMVPGEAERDKEIFVKSARGEYVGQRLTRIEPNEVYLQIRKGAVTEDVMIPFNEIYEVQVRPMAG